MKTNCISADLCKNSMIIDNFIEHIENYRKTSKNSRNLVSSYKIQTEWQQTERLDFQWLHTYLSRSVQFMLKKVNRYRNIT